MAVNIGLGNVILPLGYIILILMVAGGTNICVICFIQLRARTVVPEVINFSYQRLGNKI